jgi:glycoside/pentoside/hexuronide:cation symporter, GPH family
VTTTALDLATRQRPALWGYAMFGGLLAMAGLPIYIHAPKFYVDEYGLTLTALGTLLFVLRGFDFIQDPALGWLASRTRARRGLTVLAAGLVMAGAMVMLFALPPALPPIWWFAIALTALFSAYSFLTICFYATGAQRGDTLGQGGHVYLAGWRETGALLGVCIAAAAPVALADTLDAPFAGFALGFAGFAALALWAMRREWGQGDVTQPSGFGPVLRDRIAKRLLLIALVNALPVAITSTLFLFYAEGVLEAAGWEGALLILLFLSAAASSPVWARVAVSMGAKTALLGGMALSAGSFVFVLFLGPGDLALFAVICVVSGIGMGADLTLLPAIFSRRLADLTPDAAKGFGLWTFVSKATLAIAALIVFPALDLAGFQTGADNSATALWALTLLYAAVPSTLKLLAMALLAMTPLQET